MPDIPNRDALEAQIAKLLGKYNRQELAKLMELMKNQPMLANVPNEFWNTSQQELVKVLMPFSEMVYLEAAERMLETVPVSLANWELVNTGAADWARSYSTLLAGKINDESRKRIAISIRNSIASFFEEGLSMGELEARLAADPDLMQLFTKDVRDRLGRVYGPRRAAVIARTEVTNASMWGEVGVVKELAREGIRMVPFWQTRRDDIVCTNICLPRQGKKKGDGWYEEGAAHPGCRCWIIWKFEEPVNA